MNNVKYEAMISEALRDDFKIQFNRANSILR